MDFINEMQNIFLQAARGEVEPALWEAWWEDHAKQLEYHLSPGYFLRIKPSARPVDYASMCRSQEGILYYFCRQGRPVEKSSDYYKIKAEEEFKRWQEKRLQDYYESISPVMDAWEAFLAKHPVASAVFDWQKRLGTPPGQVPGPCVQVLAPSGPIPVPPHQVPAPLRGAGQILPQDGQKENKRLMQLRLKENMQAKIAPLAKAYGMKKAGPKTFVKEKNGIVSYLNFVGYFRGGGYETMDYCICPLYDIRSNILNLPGDVMHGEHRQEMLSGWGVIQFDVNGIDTEGINRKFDQILTFLAEEVFPRWEQIDCLETFFAPERQALFQAMLAGPPDPIRECLLWDDRADAEKPHPWGADEYLFGIWELLSGQEEAGYERLDRCLEHGKSYVKQYLKQGNFTIESSLKDPMKLLYCNAELFYKTSGLLGKNVRRLAVLETYEYVCRYMRYFHRLEKMPKM
ncbi:hypothetical protein [Eisenbergiella porci]|uniref:hypothetical protein n=1 Tax=Eisenbergiella porci TaxID=2652274 RepID=UPI002A80DF34|nr:hypothetical protein [Eisenbergiella porci]